MYHKMLNLKLGAAFLQVFKVNLVSTLLVGLGLPFILAFITAFGMSLESPMGVVIPLLGTWIYEYGSEASQYTKYLWHIVTFWFLVTLFLTVYCERWYIKKLWKEIGFISPVNVNIFMWQVHFVSYTGLIFAFVAFYVKNGI